MGLEAATYINGLVASNPDGDDGKSQGDDHLRLIKNTIKNTFPNITGAVTATHTQINKVTESGVFCFPGMIVAFSGTQAQIPAGWQLCNGVGTTALGSAVPDLRTKFIMGSTGDTGTNPSLSTGGSSTHSHTITVAGHALTIAQLPPHSHTFRVWGDTSAAAVAIGGSDGAGVSTIQTTSSVGSSETHTHGASSSSASSLPPYMALAYIIKL